MKVFYTLFILLLISVCGVAQPAPQQPDIPAIRFYPNPAVTQITFDFFKPIDRSFTFQIYNFLGKKVFEQKSVNPRTSVDLSQYYRGIYIFQLRDNTGRIVQAGRFQVAK